MSDRKKLKRMKPATRDACARIASFLLRNPHVSFAKACLATRTSRVTIEGHMDDPKSFLTVWGGALATDEAVRAVLCRSLNLQQRRYSSRRAAPAEVGPVDTWHQRMKAACIAATATLPVRYLAAHECQWPVGAQLCGHAVVGLYCSEHDELAKAQERSRYAAASAGR